MLSGSFPIFALSNHTTFSQTQTGATVPLRGSNSQQTEEELYLHASYCILYYTRKLGYSCIFLDLLGSVSQQNFLQSRLNSAMGPLSEHVFRFRENHKKVHITDVLYNTHLH